ncbi:hypothetical protein AYI70_g6932 [Smittium culicis]|uniref:Uncharacterized protein n=1 Tax=Smittium culicis TaxID=133412 RepID=A0A1R1XMU2_9FUNG|nr:hypothetical protein AYI70_g6932 [Smittium culicis]
MFYDFKSSKVLGVYDNLSTKFGVLFAQKFDELYSKMSSLSYNSDIGNISSTVGNDQYFSDIFTTEGASTSIERIGGPQKALKRAVNVLPFAPQIQVESPYFDFSLFTLNHKVRNSIVRNRLINSNCALRFYDRSSGQLKFLVSPKENSPEFSFVFGGEASDINAQSTDRDRSRSDLSGIDESGESGQNGISNSRSNRVSLAAERQSLRENLFHVHYIAHPYLPLFISTSTNFASSGGYDFGYDTQEYLVTMDAAK